MTKQPEPRDDSPAFQASASQAPAHHLVNEPVGEMLDGSAVEKGRVSPVEDVAPPEGEDRYNPEDPAVIERIRAEKSGWHAKGVKKDLADLNCGDLRITRLVVRDW